jgi:flagellin
MGISVQTNIAALNTSRNLGTAQTALSKSLQKLSSGLRINTAADDAAGLTIATNLGSQISGLTVAGRNAQDGVSVAQTADGALGQAQSLLGQLRDLAVQAANDSNDTNARTAIGTQATSIVNELNRIGQSTSFNGINLLDKSAAGGTGKLNFQVGANNDAQSSVQLDLSGADLTATATALGTLDFSSNTAARTAITTINGQIDSVSTARSTIGAAQNRFESAASSISVSIENLSASKSRITDADMASEMANFTKQQVLSSVATSMLAQANSLPQTVLKLVQ